MNRTDELIERLRTMCLGYPEAIERQTWGHPTFRVRDKIFCSAGEGDASPSATMKVSHDEQQALLASGLPFFYPDYVGSKGWIGVHLDGHTDWVEIGELVETSYRLIAPKALQRQLDEQH